MRVLIAAGGTGGHVIPALHVARELRSRGADVLFVGTPRGLESRLVPEAGFPLETIAMGGLNRVGMAQMAKTLMQLPLAFLRAGRIIDQFRPSVAFGVGAYISGPVLLMAAMKSVPIVVHEANAMPGFANRMLAPFVSRALLADAAASRFFPSTRVEVVGMPVNHAFFEIPRRHGMLHTLLIMGGSQGSSRINRATLDALAALADLRIIHQSGPRDYDAISKSARAGYEVSAFIGDMVAAMSSADLVVARAGASTLAELAAAGKAALLVPLPFAADDHQFHNARVREQAGAARVVRDSELTGERLATEIRAMLPQLSTMEENARRFAVPDATQRIADAIEAAAR